MKRSWFFLVAALLLLSISHGSARKLMTKTFSHQDSATISSSNSKVAAATDVFRLDYDDAGPNVNGKSGFPFNNTTPPPPPPPLPREA